MNPTVVIPSAESDDIAQLRNRVCALELRLDRLERGSPAPATAEPAPGPSGGAVPVAIDTEIAAATVFTRIAMLGFVLLGALILRVLTQQNFLGAGFGTILGFTYAAHLIVLSLLPGRFGRFARESDLFQCSGAVLAFFIALESALGSLTIGRVTAMSLITGFGALSVGVGLRQGKETLAGTGIIGGILALVALDMKEGTVALQLALVVLLAAAGIATSWRAGWHWMRPVTTLMMMLLLPAGFFFCRKESGVSGGLLAASAGLWSVGMLQHLGAFRQLRSAAVWLPLLTVWFAAIQLHARWPLASATNSGIAGVTLVCLLIWGRRAPESVAGLAGLIVTSAVTGAIGWAMLDHTGLLCVLGSMALWFAARRAASDWTAAGVTLLMITAAGVGLAELFRPPVPIPGLIAIFLAAVILVIHYVRNGRSGAEVYSGLAMRLAPVALGCGLVLLLGLAREVLNRLLHEPAQILLSQTAVLAITALALTFWGHVDGRRSVLFCGLACMALALMKVLLVDLVRLKSLTMLTSLVLVSVSSVVVSVILRRHK